jgi:hypothetical protein
MSMTRPFLWLAALAVVLLASASANAQKFQPFIDYDSFDPDYQFFAPAEFSDYGGGEPPNVGFYFNLESLYLNVSRPDGNPSLHSGFDGDFTWGTRYEAGYMTHEDSGWDVAFWNLNGPNNYLLVKAERLNRDNTDDMPTGTGPVFPTVDRNPRIYNIKNSINVAKLNSFELNKTWRRNEFHNGAILEPYAGVRYIAFDSLNRRDNYDRFAADTFGQLTNIPFINGPFEVRTLDKSLIKNNLLGPQVGARLSNTFGRWNLSTDVRFFALQNWQMLSHTNTQVVTRYDTGLTTPDTEQKFKTRSYQYNSEFAWGGELHGNAAYELTRDVSLQFGFTMIDMAQGLARGPDLHTFSNQNLFIAGLNIGVTINR